MNLNHLRKEKCITQLKLSKILAVDQSTVSKWERNVAFPKRNTLKKLAKVLDCTVDDLLA